MALNHADWHIDAAIESRIEAGSKFSPTINRLQHVSSKDIETYLAGKDYEAQWRAEQRTSCTCYPRGFVSMSPAVKAKLKADHIAAGRHTMGCPMWVDRTPMYSRRGDTMPPTYTPVSERRDDDYEAVEYRRG